VNYLPGLTHDIILLSSAFQVAWIIGFSQFSAHFSVCIPTMKMKEIEDAKNGKINHVCKLEKLLKCLYHQSDIYIYIYTLRAIPMKIPIIFFTNRKYCIVWNHKGLGKTKAIYEF
jgi:hypothetical protein